MKNCFRLASLIVAFGIILIGDLHADDAASSFNAGNKLFEQGRYAEAATEYEKVIQSGSVSTAAYFNLGNAYLKSGRIGLAIAAYQDARNLSPRDPDVRANLQFAREQAGGGKALTSSWQGWIQHLTFNEWTIASSVAVSALFLLLAIRQFRSEWKKSFRGTLWCLGAACLFLVTCTAIAIRAEYLLKTSVVIVPEAVVRLGPLEESQSAFTLRDGAEVAVLEKNGEWLRIADASQRTGWVLQRQLQPIGEAE